MTIRTAAFPWFGGQPAHLPAMAGSPARSALLPGDPGRVEIAGRMLHDVRRHGRRREFEALTGITGRGNAITVCSTGIGGPSAEIAVVELAAMGVRHAIRIGGMGALQADLPLGSFLIVDRAVGSCGTARVYGAGVSSNASPSVVAALVAAAADAGVTFVVGSVRTADSFYAGQGRALRAGGPVDDPDLVERLSAAGLCGFDMETEAVFAVGCRAGIETGAILAVHGNRLTDQWLEDYEPVQAQLVGIACAAVDRLAG